MFNGTLTYINSIETFAVFPIKILGFVYTLGTEHLIKIMLVYESAYILKSSSEHTPAAWENKVDKLGNKAK